MLNKKFMKHVLVVLTILFTNTVLAADTTVEMLNRLDGENMVFSKKIVRINVGDTVYWKSTDSSHNVEFIKNAVPEGVDKFKSKISEDTEYKFTIPGIYAYWCSPHKSMGMIGFVVVGKDKSNLDLIIKTKFYGKSKKIAKELIEQL